MKSNLSVVEAKTVGHNNHELTETEIITKISGGDETKGSCSSLALAYIGNKCGFDVRDFRGGNSQDAFSRSYNIENIAALDGVSSEKKKLINEAGDAAKYLKQLEPDKEFYVATGSHAAIVRNSSINGLEYLELQSHYAEKNGWKPFVNGPKGRTVIQTLKKRFGCKNTEKIFGIPIPKTLVAIDVDSFKNCNHFGEILGYVNTEEGAQKKGAWGHEK